MASGSDSLTLRRPGHAMEKCRSASVRPRLMKKSISGFPHTRCCGIGLDGPRRVPVLFRVVAAMREKGGMPARWKKDNPAQRAGSEERIPEGEAGGSHSAEARSSAHTASLCRVPASAKTVRSNRFRAFRTPSMTHRCGAARRAGSGRLATSVYLRRRVSSIRILSNSKTQG